MEPNAQPVSKPGERNLLCPHYEGCLDYAVDHRWQSWDCSECPYQVTKQALTHAPMAKDEDPLYDVPGRIFQAISHWID